MHLNAVRAAARDQRPAAPWRLPSAPRALSCRPASPRQLMTDIESPCNKVCTVDPISRLCVGCGRSLAEIEGWIRFGAAERARIMAEVPRRLAALDRLRAERAASDRSAAEEAGLLALGRPGGGETRSRRLRARLRLRLLSQREPQAGESPGSTVASMYDWSLRGSAPARRAACRRARRCARSGRSRARRRPHAPRTRASSAKRNAPLQRMHGFGVSPPRSRAAKGSTTALRNSSRRSSVTCGSPSA